MLMTKQFEKIRLAWLAGLKEAFDKLLPSLVGCCHVRDVRIGYSYQEEECVLQMKLICFSVLYLSNHPPDFFSLVRMPLGRSSTRMPCSWP